MLAARRFFQQHSQILKNVGMLLGRNSEVDSRFSFFLYCDEVAQHFFGMGFRFCDVVNLFDVAHDIDEEGHAIDFFCVTGAEKMGRECVVVMGDFSVDVGEERKRKAALFRKMLVACDGVRAYAKHGYVKLPEFLKMISQGAGLRGASWRFIFWVEI